MFFHLIMFDNGLIVNVLSFVVSNNYMLGLSVSRLMLSFQTPTQNCTFTTCPFTVTICVHCVDFNVLLNDSI